MKCTLILQTSKEYAVRGFGRFCELQTWEQVTNAGASCLQIESANDA